MPVPDYSDPTPVRRQIAEDLRGQIRAGAYAAGDRLPANLELAKRYGVAPETIRAALEELRTEGTVETRSTRGTFATGKPPASAPPDLGKLREEVADLAKRTVEYEDLCGRVEQLEAKFNRLEADIRYLFNKGGDEFGQGGEHDTTQKAPRRGRAGR